MESSGLRFTLDREVAAPGEVLQATVENHASCRFSVENAYELEERVRDIWCRCSPSDDFALKPCELGPGEVFSQPIRVPRNASPGRYRVTKEADMMAADGCPKRRVPVWADFRVPE